MTPEIQPHLVLVQHINADMREYHVTRDVAQHKYCFGKEYCFSEGKPGAMPLALAGVLDSTAGVVGGSLERYEINVQKGDAFSWDDVGPLVTAQIVAHVYPEVIGAQLAVTVQRGVNHLGRYFTLCERRMVNIPEFSGRPRLDNIEQLLQLPINPVEEAEARERLERNRTHVLS